MDKKEEQSVDSIDVNYDKSIEEGTFGSFFIRGAYFGSAVVLAAYVIEILL